jgi:general secretion pathway protein E
VDRSHPETAEIHGQLRSQFVAALQGSRADDGADEETQDVAHSLPISPVSWATEQGYSECDQLRAFAKLFALPTEENPECLKASPDYVRDLEIAFSRRHSVLGLAAEEGPLPVAVCNWEGWQQLDIISRSLGRSVQPVISTDACIQAAINVAYQERNGETQQLIETLDEQEVLSEIQGFDGKEDLLDTADRAPVIKLVNLILFEAGRDRASDVHIQPYEDRVVVRQRIDGVLFDCFEIPKVLQEAVITRIKVLGKMNVAEKRLPQDGRATVEVGDRIIDLRIASLPTSHRERIVIRLLDKSARLYTLGELGMRDSALLPFRKLIEIDHGLILVTGPTGSGKSTTLYAALQEINTTDQNVLTLEDPIEYQLDGISQSQINEKKGMTFASGLRNVLRQDPDIIMVGEIRDRETAVMAIQASLTGHLVFSTLHTNDAASAVTRLLDLGIEPYLVASSLVAVLAQRLVRRICPYCQTDVIDDDDQRRQTMTPEQREKSMTIGAGCENCRQTGYQGRVGLFEMLVVDDHCREIVQSLGNAAEIRTAAIDSGMELLEEDGMAKVFAGLTSYAEVLRVAKPGNA